jgi:hypothetical protein
MGQGGFEVMTSDDKGRNVACGSDDDPIPVQQVQLVEPTGSLSARRGTALEPVWVVTILNHHSYVYHCVYRSKPGHFI